MPRHQTIKHLMKGAKRIEEEKKSEMYLDPMGEFWIRDNYRNNYRRILPGGANGSAIKLNEHFDTSVYDVEFLLQKYFHKEYFDRLRRKKYIEDNMNWEDEQLHPRSLYYNPLELSESEKEIYNKL